jgi:hypothetical protein
MALAGIGIVLVSAERAAADGCFFGPIVQIEQVGQSTSLVASPKQEAILASDGKMVQVVLRTHFRAGPPELAWVVPVPARPMNIQKVDDAVFSKLEEVTAPRFYRLTEGTGFQFHFGCGAAAEQTTVISAPVRVEETGSAGIFDYAVLSADDPTALAKWLNENKYHVHDSAEAILKRYVEKKWHWLAMKVRPEASEQKTLAPHPITYTYQSSELVFPLVISRISAEAENEIVLYVVGRHRFCCSNWSNRTLDDFSVRQVSKPAGKGGPPTSGTNYEDLVRQYTAQYGGHLFVTEFSDPRWDTIYWADLSRQINAVLNTELVKVLGKDRKLTRMRAYVPAEAMDRDVELAEAKDQGQVGERVRLASASAEPNHTTVLALAPAMLLLSCCGALIIPLRPGSKRNVLRACLVLALGVCLVGCSNDPKAPLEQAAREINDVRSLQAQTVRLVPLQEQLRETLAGDPHVQRPQVALYFGRSPFTGPYAARLVVEFVTLLEIDPRSLPTTQPSEQDQFVRDLVRAALGRCGWEVEELDSYQYEGRWRVCGQVRGEGKPPPAGAGLDVLPDGSRLPTSSPDQTNDQR